MVFFNPIQTRHTTPNPPRHSLTVQQRHVQRRAAVRVAVVQIDARPRAARFAGGVELGVGAAAAARGGGQSGGQRLPVASLGGVVQGAGGRGGGNVGDAGTGSAMGRAGATLARPRPLALTTC